MIGDELLTRLRGLVRGRPGVVEKAMVGGRSFSRMGRTFSGVNGNGLLVRVGQDGRPDIVDLPYVSPMVLGGRTLRAFVTVAPAGVETDAALAKWVQLGLDVVTRESATVGPAERFADLCDQLSSVSGVMLPGAGGGRGFGSTALRYGGSIFAMLTRDQLVVKLPAHRVTELIEAGTGEPFTAGKTAPMREWLAVTVDDAPTWRQLATEALAFVGAP